MKVECVDERSLGEQGYGANFVAFIYDGDDDDRDTSWSVDSFLLTETDLPQALGWLRENLPQGCCWSLGVVLEPRRPTPADGIDVAWIIGDDVLNVPPESRDAEEQRVAEEMVTRRHRVPEF